MRPDADSGPIEFGFPKPAGAERWHWSATEPGFVTVIPRATKAIDELHRAILALDPDAPEAPMPETLIRDHGEVLTARNAGQVAELITTVAAGPHAAFLQRARETEGTGTLGLYIEAVSFDSVGAPFSHMRFFVVGTHLWAYNRSVGDNRANWRHRDTETLDQSLAIVQTAIDKPSVKVFGHPVLTELTSTDISTIESGAAPPSRFRSQSRIERDFGRYDFEMPVVSKPVPHDLIAILRAQPFAEPF